MSGPDRVPVPRLATRSSTMWQVGTGVAVVGVMAYVWVTQPQNRGAVAVVLPLLVLAAVWVVSARTWVEPGTGTVVRESFRLRRRRADLDSASSIALVNNRGGALLLGIRHRRTLYVPILALNDYVERSQSPEFLRLLADQIDAHAPGARQVADQLRRQAAFVAGGGAAAESPLAGLITHGALRAAKAGGIGSLFH